MRGGGRNVLLYKVGLVLHPMLAELLQETRTLEGNP